MFCSMSHKKKNFLTIVISILLSIFIFYFLFFLKVNFEQHHKAPYLFKSIETLKFHRKYSKQIHHLRFYGQIHQNKPIIIGLTL